MNRGKSLKAKKLRRSTIKKIIIVIIILIIIAFSIISILNSIIEKDGSWTPDYPKIELGEIINKEVLAEDDYYKILMQTGLGKPAVDDLLEGVEKGLNKDSLLDKYQDDFFSSGNYECRNVAWIVYEERNRNEKGELISGFEIPNLKDGDILITKSTHTAGWRHGHAAIVTDASKGETLEAVLLGENTKIQNTRKWQTFSSFMLLRLKPDANDLSEDIAKFALENLSEIPYGLFSGIPVKAPEGVKKTQCSHLVWYAYHHFGYDLDSDGSWLVTPKDIANSELLEIVQVYGVNPEEIWP